MEKTKRFIKELIPYVVILVVVIIIRTYLVTPVMVSGPSMNPTLKGNEIMVLNKINNDYERYDIVVVHTEHGEIIKRVIALPGETIQCNNNKIYINGRKLEKDYGMGTTSNINKTKLKDDEYFVLGDNRENSMDSRYYGPINIKRIKGKTSFIVFPFNKFGRVNRSNSNE